MQNAYDELGRAKGSTYVIGDTTQAYGITYEDITGLVKNYTTPGNSFTYTYDAFDRLTQKLETRHAIAYTYVAGSQRVATYNFSQADATNITYSYTYDALGNITQIKKNGTTVSNYEYDSLGRLIREDDCTNSVSWVYTYDNAGNLLKKYTFYGMTGIPASHLLSLHPYNGSEISSTYTYSSSAWGDLLTGYNGTEIEYDAIGNPLNWHNAASMLWDGRKLTYFSEDALDHGIAFAYNSDGIRTKKTLYDYDGSTITHNYILDGSTILKETITSGSGTSTLYYYYDESGISGLEYNGTKYSYVKNLQGDVIRIINANGVTVVEYNYDAWGNILSTTGSMASTLGAANPFRYRGYYYDTESGWYYLNSRYYDPLVGRFVNADGIVGANGGIMGYNMFAYCNNNPVMYVDPNGFMVLGKNRIKQIFETENPEVGGGIVAAGLILWSVAEKAAGVLEFIATLFQSLGAGVIDIVDAITVPYEEDEYYDTHQDVVATDVAEDIAEEEEEGSPYVYYGAAIRGDNSPKAWKLTTDPMSLTEAVAWVHKTASSGSYGRHTIWGVYANSPEAALALAVCLFGDEYYLEKLIKGERRHYHKTGHTYLNYEHFHIWYGPVM